jgi:hypothetical protein
MYVLLVIVSLSEAKYSFWYVSLSEAIYQ